MVGVYRSNQILAPSWPCRSGRPHGRPAAAPCQVVETSSLNTAIFPWLRCMIECVCIYICIYIYDYRHIIPPKHVEKQLITILVGFYFSFRGGICVHCSIPVCIYVYIYNKCSLRNLTVTTCWRFKLQPCYPIRVGFISKLFGTMIPSQFGDGWLNQQHWTRKIPTIFHHEPNCHSILDGGVFPMTTTISVTIRNQIVIQTVHWCHHVWSWHLNPLNHCIPRPHLAPLCTGARLFFATVLLGESIWCHEEGRKWKEKECTSERWALEPEKALRCHRKVWIYPTKVIRNTGKKQPFTIPTSTIETLNVIYIYI